MSSMQNRLVEIPIGAFCQTGSGGTPSRSKASRYFGGSIPWVKSGELRETVITETEEYITKKGLEESAAKLLPVNTLLVALYGATVGRVGVLGVEAATNQAVCYIIPDEHRADRKYLYYALQSKVPVWLSQRVGGGQPNISQGIIRNTKIPLPPLSEQKRIADILDKADAIRRKRQEAVDLLESSKVATFHEIFGDPIQNSKRWTRQPLGQLLKSIDSGISPRCLDRPVSSGEWGILKLGAVTWCEYDWTQNKALPETFAPDPSLEVKHGDLLFTRKNTHELVAAAAFVYQTPQRLMLPDLIFRLRLRPDAPVLPEYLWGLLTYPTKRRQIQALAGGAAGSMPNISKAKLLQQLVEVPPVSAQEAYARFLQQVHETRLRTETSRKASDDLFNALLQRAFKGEI